MDDEMEQFVSPVSSVDVTEDTQPDVPENVSDRAESVKKDDRKKVEFHCSVCPKTFRSRSGYYAHVKSHADSSPVACTVCNKEFVGQHNMKEHRRTHVQERPHKCRVCGKIFADEEAQKTHMVVHDSEKLHKCQDCGRCFKHGSALSRHKMVHSGEKPHSCKECGKTFTRRSGLQRHAATHGDQKLDESCLECGKTFAHKASLLSHMKTHSKDNPSNSTNETSPADKNHVCETCGKGFKHRSSLNRHKATHAEGKPGTAGNSVQMESEEKADDTTKLETKDDQVPSPEPNKPEPCQVYFERLLNGNGVEETTDKPAKVEPKEVCSKGGESLKWDELVKQQICGECGQQIKCFRDLQKHQLSHAEKNAIPCVICGQRFKYLPSLGSHIRVHFKQKTR